MTREMPVRLQTTIVSRKVAVMETSPWRTGSFVVAAAAAIGAEPRPASFEKMPRAIPFCIATSIVPATPPAMARGLNAPMMIWPNAHGTLVIFAMMSVIVNTK